MKLLAVVILGLAIPAAAEEPLNLGTSANRWDCDKLPPLNLKGVDSIYCTDSEGNRVEMKVIKVSPLKPFELPGSGFVFDTRDTRQKRLRWRDDSVMTYSDRGEVVGSLVYDREARICYQEGDITAVFGVLMSAYDRALDELNRLKYGRKALKEYKRLLNSFRWRD